MNGNVEGSFLGLGYYHHPSSSASTPQPDTPTVTSDSAVDAANKLMQQYLQQCLGYHHEQEEQRRKEQEAPIVDTSTEIQFVPAVVETPLDTIEYAPAASLDTTAQPQTSTIEDTSLVQSQVQEGRLRVQEILKRFQQQQEQFLQSQSSVPPTEDIDGTATTTAITDIALIPDITTPSLSQQQRTTGFQREAVRKHGALLKNLEYVAAKQERRLYELNAQAEQSRLDQARMQDHHRAVLEERKRARTMWNDSSQSAAAVAGIGIGIGIGTQQRIKVSEHNKRAKGRVPLDGGTIADTDEQTSVAIYLSGLATDGSFGEDSVRGLFSSYGKMVKVHVYRNKRTGGLKGDALIVYQVPDKTEGDALIQMVCSQMNGAELPCGSVLHVEPASSNNAASGTTSQQSHYGPAKSQALERPHGEVEKDETPAADNDDDDEEDLDDFFDSL